MSQSCQATTKCIFGWGKQHETMRKPKHRHIASVAADFLLNLIAYNLVRIPKLCVGLATICPSRKARTHRRVENARSPRTKAKQPHKARGECLFS